MENNCVAGWAGTNHAVLVIIFKQADANVIETVDRIKAVLPELEKWLPPTVKISVLSDRTTTIRASVDEVQFSLMLSIAPGGDGHFSVSAAVLADVHRQHHRAAGAGRHLRLHVSAAITAWTTFR